MSINIKHAASHIPVKVPVIMQLESLECGAACLCMILGYYNKWVALEQMRVDCGVSRDGSKASNILRAARSYGLSSQGFRYEPEQLRAKGKYPCIIHWNFNHFVVLNGFSRNKAYINDPAQGPRSVSMAQFDKSFTGVCILFEPSADFVSEGKPKRTLDFVKKRMAGTGAAVGFVILTTAIASLLGVINPAFSRIFLDRLLTKQNPEWVYPFLLGMGVLAVITLAVDWIQAVYSLKLSGKLAIVASSTFFWHVIRMPLTFFSQRMAGDIAMRQKLNEGVADTLVQTFAPLILKTAMMVFYLFAMLRYSVVLALIGIASILINVVMSRIISAKRVNVMRVQMRDEAKLSATTVAGIEMIETIKASGAENGFFEKWAGYQAGANAQMVKFANINNYLGLIPSLVSSITSTAVLMVGVFLTIQGEFSAGMIMAFQGFMIGFASPAQALISAGQSLQEMRTNMERIDDVMEYPTDVNYDNSTECTEHVKLTGDIVIKNITFGYSRLEPPLIENFSLHLKSGSRIAFVGSSGCGKSTLSKLISGLYRPWSGEILFDGKPIDEVNHTVFTGSMAVVDQDIILFEDTISNNIKMWDSSIEDFEVIMAARDADIHDDIVSREGGYQSMLTEGGKNFSGGQRQRIEIARVLAQDPTILILDEATSALDSKTEFDVVSSIKNRGITCIVIAHRLSTIRDCDEIVVMDRGKVVEHGTHNELSKKGGLYSELVSNE